MLSLAFCYPDCASFLFKTIFLPQPFFQQQLLVLITNLYAFNFDSFVLRYLSLPSNGKNFFIHLHPRSTKQKLPRKKA